MEHSIELNDKAFRAYENRAKQLGLSVSDYLNQSAPLDDRFSLTPEMRAGIERGLAQADAGDVVGMNEVRESLATYRAEWRKSNP